MPYTLYVDRNENFQCEVAVKNASLKGSIARLIVESEGANFVFNGKLENGKCIIPIKRLKGLLQENDRGRLFLEVIVEDTYFKPWESDFLVQQHTQVKVKVNEPKISTKPIVEVKVHPPKKKVITSNKKSLTVPLKEISTICKRFGIVRKNILARQDDFLQIIKEYFKNSSEYNNHKSVILERLPSFLK